jgi:hypothetical protein
MERRGDKVYRHKTADFYTCSTYDLGKNKFQKVCSNHFIRTSVIREIVLDAIRKTSAYVRGNEAEFIEKIREASAVQRDETAKSHRRQLAKNERRVAELDNLFRKVYEDNATGKLSDERFTQLSGAYESEQAELRQQSTALRSELEAFEADSEKAEKFIGIVRRYTEFDALSTAMLNEFVQKILVHAPDKSSGERVQEVDVYLNFIGKFDLPIEEEAPPTQEELAAQEKRRKRLARQREANRRFYAKRKAEAEWKKAVEAGAVTQEEIDAADRERQAQEQAQQSRREQRVKEKREYKRDWARQNRASKKGQQEQQSA